MAISIGVKRILVLLLAVAMFIVAILQMVMCAPNIFCIIINILLAIGAFGGIVGAWRMDQRHLLWFFWTLCVLIVIEIAYIIFNFLHYHDDRDYAWHETTYNFVTLAILVIGLICTYDLRRAGGGGGYGIGAGAPLLGGAGIGGPLV